MDGNYHQQIQIKQHSPGSFPHPSPISFFVALIVMCPSVMATVVDCSALPSMVEKDVGGFDYDGS